MQHSNHRSFKLFAAGLVGALALLVGLAASTGADILVMEDGSRLEIEGEWTEKGRMIEFILPNGTFGAVRAAEVDLEASREATRAAVEMANAPPPPPPKKPEPVQVITDKDIPAASPEIVAASRKGVTARSIRVSNWGMSTDSNPDIVRMIRGTLRNYGALPVSSITLTVTLIGTTVDDETPTLTRQASLESSSLEAGEATEFEVPLRRTEVAPFGGPSTLESADVTFEVAFQTEEATDEEETDEADEAGADES